MRFLKKILLRRQLQKMLSHRISMYWKFKKRSKKGLESAGSFFDLGLVGRRSEQLTLAEDHFLNHLSGSKNGFTLIEMLIVITIIGLLTIGAVSSYDVARRQARLNVVADTLVSSIKEQQSLARAGKIDVPSAGQRGQPSGRFCYGLFFKKEAAVQMVKAPFVAADSGISPSKSNFCNLNQSQLSNLSVIDAPQVRSIKKFRDEVDALAIVFVPPFAKVLTGTALDMDTLLSLDSAVADPTVCLTIGLPNIKDEAFIVFDVTSGMVSRVRSSC